jgi:hypothetical protein
VGWHGMIRLGDQSREVAVPCVWFVLFGTVEWCMSGLSLFPRSLPKTFWWGSFMEMVSAKTLAFSERL